MTEKIKARLAELEKSQPVPVLFDELLGGLEIAVSLRDEIGTMIDEKAGGSEGDGIARLESLDDFIEASLAEIGETIGVLPSRRPAAGALDELFRSALESDGV